MPIRKPQQMAAGIIARKALGLKAGQIHWGETSAPFEETGSRFLGLSGCGRVPLEKDALLELMETNIFQRPAV